MNRCFLKKVGILTLSFFFFFALLNFTNFSNDNFIFASRNHPEDQGCYDMGGKCMELSHERPYGFCRVNEQKGRIFPWLCNSDKSQRYRCCVPLDESKNSACADEGGICVYLNNPEQTTCFVGLQQGFIKKGLCKADPSSHYRCCIPLKDEEKKEEEERRDEEKEEKPPSSDPVLQDEGCYELGGVCQETDTLGTCEIKGQEGCYVLGACRNKEQNFLEGKIWACCVPGKDQCEAKVDYGLWGNVIFNVNEDGIICPFSKVSVDEDRTFCTQGPYNSASHGEQNSIDLGYKGEYGTEYFIAPEDGIILEAHQRYKNGRSGCPEQLCGGILEIETNSGVNYRIMHAFVFASLRKDYVGGLPPTDTEGNILYREFKKGDVLAKIAIEDDGDIIKTLTTKECSNTCATGHHFHVKVEGVEINGKEKCADCHFVDDLDCNLQNESQVCADGLPVRCFRHSELTKECEHCAECDVNSINYCCHKDCVEVEGKKICQLVDQEEEIEEEEKTEEAVAVCKTDPRCKPLINTFKVTFYSVNASWSSN